ncbi:hypothetical protein BKA83DRAFT_12638 [Pisolithus microcarpus]|nr:hypothetical protein BKA83DRAFT_12638 [Pisolithus microcarpus]
MATDPWISTRETGISSTWRFADETSSGNLQPRSVDSGEQAVSSGENRSIKKLLCGISGASDTRERVQAGSRTATNHSTTARELSLISNPCDVLKERSQVSSRFSNQPALLESIASFVIPAPKILCSQL